MAYDRAAVSCGDVTEPFWKVDQNERDQRSQNGQCSLDPEGTDSVLNVWTTLGAGCSDEDFLVETEQITAIPKPY
jgi:hypothetical protein